MPTSCRAFVMILTILAVEDPLQRWKKKAVSIEPTVPRLEAAGFRNRTRSRLCGACLRLPGHGRVVKEVDEGKHGPEQDERPEHDVMVGKQHARRGKIAPGERLEPAEDHEEGAAPKEQGAAGADAKPAAGRGVSAQPRCARIRGACLAVAPACAWRVRRQSQSRPGGRGPRTSGGKAAIG